MRNAWWVTGVVLGIAAGCGDNGGGSSGGSGGETTGNSTGATTMGSDPSGPGPTSESATQGSMSNSETGVTTAGPTSDPTSDPTVGVTSTTTQGSNTDPGTSTTAGTTDGTAGTTGTTGGVCPVDQQCGDLCCGGGELCVEGQCQVDCGGPPPCGPQQDCCADGDVCHLGQCVTPQGTCMQATCATIAQSDCPDGFVCNLDLQLCLPTQADETCKYIPPNATFKPVPLFTWGSRAQVACQNATQCQTAETCSGGFCKPTWPHLTVAANDMPTHNQSSSIAVVADLDRDCVPEIIFNTYRPGVITSDGVLRVIRGDNGAKVWTVTDPAWRTDSTANPAVGDLNNDGTAEIVVQGAGKFLLAFDSAGKGLWKSAAFNMATVSGSVAIANVDNDGDAEVIFGSAVFDSAGKKLYEGVTGIGLNGQGPISCVADLNADGRQELIAGKVAHSFTGTVGKGDFAGKVLWTATPGDGFCGVADFNGDKKPEVILVSKAVIYALNGQTGAVIAQAPIPNGGSGGTPNIADFDGDKVPEVAAAGSTAYIVYKFDGTKFTKLWSAVTQDVSSQVTGSSVFDFDGDGRAEVVYNDEQFIRIYPGVEPDCQKNPPGPACDGNMTDAEILFKDKNGSRTRTEYPIIADVDGDFKAEIVFPTNNDAATKVDAGLEVWGDSLDNWVATRPVWNQHTYHFTNVGIVGEIPQSELPSWSTPDKAPYNSYRRNVQGDDGTAYCAPDLQVADLDVDYALCPTLQMTVSVANVGCLGVGPGVNVSFYEKTIGYLGTVQTQGPLDAGSSEQVAFEYKTAQEPSEIWAVVDDDGQMMGALNECKEDNNKTPLLLVCVPDPE